MIVWSTDSVHMHQHDKVFTASLRNWALYRSRQTIPYSASSTSLITIVERRNLYGSNYIFLALTLNPLREQHGRASSLNFLSNAFNNLGCFCHDLAFRSSNILLCFNIRWQVCSKYRALAQPQRLWNHLLEPNSQNCLRYL